MKKRISREELIEIRKRKQSEKEMEFELGRDLSQEFHKKENFERFREGKNPYILHAINFFGTLFILYFVYFVILYKIKFTFSFFFAINVEYGFFIWSVQILFWIAAFLSLFSRKTVVDFLLEKYLKLMS